MLKKTITYEDYNGKEHTEDFYFNLSKVELVDMGVSDNGGMVETIREIIQTENQAGLIAIFQNLLLKAYGIKSEDGKRFIKSDALRTEFSQTEAYSVLFMELASNAESAAEFMNKVIPASLSEEVSKQTEQITKDPTAMTKEELLELLSKKTQ